MITDVAQDQWAGNFELEMIAGSLFAASARGGGGLAGRKKRFHWPFCGRGCPPTGLGRPPLSFLPYYFSYLRETSAISFTPASSGPPIKPSGLAEVPPIKAPQLIKGVPMAHGALGTPHRRTRPLRIQP